MRLSVAKRSMALFVAVMVCSTAAAQERPTPCECRPCGGRFVCPRGTIGWCGCRGTGCDGGCLRKEADRHELAASVLSIIMDEEVTSSSLKEDPARFSRILRELLGEEYEGGTLRVRYKNRELGFVLTTPEVLKLQQIRIELLSQSLGSVVVPSPPTLTLSPIPTATPTPTPLTPEQIERLGKLSYVALVQRTNGPNLFVLLVLLVMWVRALTILRRCSGTYRAAKEQSREFAPRVAQALKNDRFEEAMSISDRYRRSHLAAVVATALQEFAGHERGPEFKDEEIAASEGAMRRIIAIQKLVFSRGLPALAAVSSTAVMVGLIGMLLAFFRALQMVRLNPGADSADVTAEALNGLLILALGFALRVLAKWRLNNAEYRVQGFTLEMEASASEVIDYIQKIRRRRA